jgi:hypothetical protein
MLSSFERVDLGVNAGAFEALLHRPGRLRLVESGNGDGFHEANVRP